MQTTWWRVSSVSAWDQVWEGKVAAVSTVYEQGQGWSRLLKLDSVYTLVTTHTHSHIHIVTPIKGSIFSLVQTLWNFIVEYVHIKVAISTGTISKQHGQFRVIGRTSSAHKCIWGKRAFRVDLASCHNFQQSYISSTRCSYCNTQSWSNCNTSGYEVFHCSTPSL